MDYVYIAADRLDFYVKPDGNFVAYDWDANGNMVSRSVVSGQSSLVTSFAYDYDNRLVKITYPDGKVIEFGYDGIGRRAWRKEGNIVRSFFYDGDRIIAEREGNSWVVRHLVSLSPLLPVGFVSGGVRIYHSDRIGSVRFVTDANQNILVSYVYEGFGKIVGQNGGGGGPYQFCGLWGYRNDWDAGLLHVGARYYEPETGRFVQEDSLIISQNYVYCRNNPQNYVDLNGLDHHRVEVIKRKEYPLLPDVKISIPGIGIDPGPFIPFPPTCEPWEIIWEPYPKLRIILPIPDPSGRSDIGVRIGPFPILPKPLPPIYIEKPPGQSDWFVKAGIKLFEW